MGRSSTKRMSSPGNSNINSEISSKLLGNPNQGQSAAKNVECKYDKEYLIYEDGRLFSKKTNRFLKGKIDNVGYIAYNLAIVNPLTGKKGKMFYAHRLVAEHFLENPKNLPYVHHKDRDKLNNHVDNLQWVTGKENYEKHLTKEKKPKYYIKDLEGEEWKEIQELPNYLVSNKGRIRNQRTNRLLHMDNSQTYTRVYLNNKKHYYVHRLVYCTFHNDYDLDGYVIDHLDFNPKNNVLENLEKVTHSENNKRRFQH